MAALGLAGCQPPPPGSAAPPGPLESGRNALRAGQFDAAIADADNVLRGNPHGPDAAEALYIKGFALENQTFAAPTPGDRRQGWFEARSAYTRALGERPVPPLAGFIRSGLSNVALYQDDFPTAIEQAELAMPLLPDRPGTRAAVLFNEGEAQRRMGRFSDADQTYRRVAQQFPGTPVAAAAQQREGQRLFYVQLAIYPTPADADRAAATLRSTGAGVSRGTDARGRTKLDLGPFSTYAAAQQQRDALAVPFPAALIVP